MYPANLIGIAPNLIIMAANLICTCLVVFLFFFLFLIRLIGVVALVQRHARGAADIVAHTVVEPTLGFVCCDFSRSLGNDCREGWGSVALCLLDVLGVRFPGGKGALDGVELRGIGGRYFKLCLSR